MQLGERAHKKRRETQEEDGDDADDMTAGECARARWLNRGTQAGEGGARLLWP